MARRLGRVLVSAMAASAVALMAGPASSGSAGGPAPQPRFENFRWLIVSYFDGGRLVDSRTAASIAFVEGRVEGSGDCGAFGGNYFLSGPVVRIRAETVLDDGPCFAANLDEAKAILEALNTGERRIEQRADRIVLRDTSGAVRIVLTPGQ